VTAARLRDALHQTAKRAQRRLLLADYEELRARRRWLRHDPTAPFEEHVLAVRPDPGALREILVFKPDELGDAVYALPALRELRAHVPHAKISLICRPLTRDLYERSGLVDHITTFEPLARPLRSRRRLRAALDGLPVRSFDLAIYLKSPSPAVFPDFLRVPARARLHPLDPRMRSSSVYRADLSAWGDVRRHQALQQLEIVGLLTGRTYTFDDVVFPPFRWTDSDVRAVHDLLGDRISRPYVVLHPFAKDETRRYPSDQWTALVGELDARLGRPSWVVVGGPEDGAFSGGDNVVQAQGKLSIGQTGYLLDRAAAMIGNISGPVHWAAALGTPTVTLMSGHSLPAEWAPLGASLVLRASVPCAPCHRKTCPVYALACLTELRPELIVGPIEEFVRPHLASVREVAGELAG
jgi:ADP-heptose:LPS heptosyltransferase